jgi:predicted Zn-dependent peptidase
MTGFGDKFVWGVYSQPMIHQAQLENGLALLLEPSPSSALVCFELFVPHGAINEPHLGCSSLQEEWLRRGAGGRSAQDFEDAWDELGIIRGSEVGLEGLEWSVTCLAEDAPRALALLSDWVLRPNLLDEEFAPSLELAKAALHSLEDAPDEILYTRLWDAAFSSRHKRSPYGSLDGFLQLTPELARADYHRRCTPKGAILTACGTLEWWVLLELANKHFANWTGQPLTSPEVVWNPAKTHFEPRDTAQTQIGKLMPLMPFAGAGYYESRFALEVLGGGNSSRLFHEVREKRGLVYGIHAGNSFVRGAGMLEIFASCTPQHTAETLEVVDTELLRWQQGISQEEFTHAQVGIETALAMSSESVGARAANLMRDVQLLGRPREKSEIEHGLAGVTLGAVNAWLEGLDFSQMHTFVLGVDVKTVLD